MVQKAGHDAIAGAESGGLNGGAGGDDSTGALVGGSAGKGRVYDVFADHGVGMAEGGDGYANEEVVGSKGGRGGNIMDFVGLVELGVVSRGFG